MDCSRLGRTKSQSSLWKENVKLPTNITTSQPFCGNFSLTEVTVSEECQAYHKAKFQWQDTMDTAGLCPHVLSGSIELKR